MPLPITSSAPRVKKALVEKLEAFAAEEGNAAKGVQIAFAHPGTAIAQESIYFNRTLLTEAAAQAGKRRRDEDYTIELVVDVAQDGDYAQAAEERAWELVGVIETYLREHPEVPTLTEPTGTVSGWVVFAGAEMTPYILEGTQRLAEVVCRIGVKNRK